MTTETMTVHKALCELKTLDARIEKEIGSIDFVGYKKASEDKYLGKKVSEYEKEVNSRYQKICDLISREDALKKALNAYNSTTKITVCGDEMTIAEALYFMGAKQKHRKRLVEKLIVDNRVADDEIVMWNEKELPARTDKYIASVFGNAKDSQDPDKIASMTKIFKEENVMEKIDPLNAAKKAEALADWIDEFMAEVDGALQTANAVNEITISY